MSLNMNDVPNQYSSNIPPPPPLQDKENAKPPTLPPLPPLYTGVGTPEPLSTTHTVDRSIKARFQRAVDAVKDIFGQGALRWSPSQTAKVRNALISHAVSIKGGYPLNLAETQDVDRIIGELQKINTVRKSTLKALNKQEAPWTVRKVTTMQVGGDTYELQLGRNFKALFVQNVPKILGKGSYGVVSQVATDLKTDTAILNKLGKTHEYETPRDLINEVEFPKRLHSRARGHQTGIQRSPYSIMHIRSPTEIRWGLYVPGYKSTLEPHNLLNNQKEYGLESKKGPARLLQGIFTGVRAVHDAGMAHRDIKPENSGVQKAPNGKLESCLADFGLASSKERLSYDPLGTSWYITIDDHNAQSVDAISDESRLALQQKQDIYAVGVTSLIVLGSLLFTDGDINFLYEALHRHRLGGEQENMPLRDSMEVKHTLDAIEHQMGPKFKDLLYKMLDPNPNLRPNSTEAERAWKRAT